MEIEVSDEIAPKGEQRQILESIVRDTGENFKELLEFAEIDQLSIGGPAEYKEFYSTPMNSPGSSPPLWQHNPFSEDRIQIFVQDLTHVPHEMAHQIENIAEKIEKVSGTESRNFETRTAPGKAFSESFAYLNQLKYFPKLPDVYSVEFDDIEKLREEDISWQEYSNHPDHADLYHTAGYQTAFTLHENDVNPVQLVKDPEKYRKAAEDAVAAAWVEAQNNRCIDRDQYNKVVSKSVENHLKE